MKLEIILCGGNPEPLPWEEDFEYVPDVFSHIDPDELDLEWETHHITLYGNRVEVPRRIVMYGGAYTYSGVSHPASRAGNHAPSHRIPHGEEIQLMPMQPLS